MIQQDFSKAIHLLMEGTTTRETAEVRRVRKAWKESNGDPHATLKAYKGADIMPREKAILQGLKRYSDNPLEALRCLNHSMRMFYVNAYQSYIWNLAASRRMKIYGNHVVEGDLYYDSERDERCDVKVVKTTEDALSVNISQIVLPLPGYKVRYPENEIGEFYASLLQHDNVRFEKIDIPEATAKGSYRKLIVHPVNLTVEMNGSDSTCKSMKLCFQLPKGCYATMLLRELMLKTADRSNDLS